MNGMDDQRPVIDVKRSGLKAVATSFQDDPVGGYAAPGSVEMMDGHMLLACPGCGYVSGIRVGHPKPERSPSWDVAGGNFDVPTLTLHPSINCVNCCGWHGWLAAGVFNSC